MHVYLCVIRWVVYRRLTLITKRKRTMSQKKCTLLSKKRFLTDLPEVDRPLMPRSLVRWRGTGEELMVTQFKGPQKIQFMCVCSIEIRRPNHISNQTKKLFIPSWQSGLGNQILVNRYRKSHVLTTEQRTSMRYFFGQQLCEFMCTVYRLVGNVTDVFATEFVKRIRRLLSKRPEGSNPRSIGHFGDSRNSLSLGLLPLCDSTPFQVSGSIFSPPPPMQWSLVAMEHASSNTFIFQTG